MRASEFYAGIASELDSIRRRSREFAAANGVEKVPSEMIVYHSRQAFNFAQKLADTEREREGRL